MIPCLVKMWRTCVRIVLTLRPVADGPALGQLRRHPALGRREAESRRHEMGIDARPASLVDNQHERRDRPSAVLRVLAAYRVDVQPEALEGCRASHRHRAGRAPTAVWREDPRQQPLKTGVVFRQARGQETVFVEEGVAGPEQAQGMIVRRHDPPAPVQLDDSGSGGGEQFVE